VKVAAGNGKSFGLSVLDLDGNYLKSAPIQNNANFA
jgi:hypothetical protein